jgi:hypothetical protein
MDLQVEDPVLPTKIFKPLSLGRGVWGEGRLFALSGT